MNPHRTSVHAPEYSLSYRQSSTKSSSHRFELRETEHQQIIGPPLNQELAEGHGIGEIPRIKVELGAADVSTAERTNPGDLCLGFDLT